MHRPRVCLVLGTRPQLIKATEVVKAHRANNHGFDLHVLDTGQHYDPSLSSSATTGLAERHVLASRADDHGRVGLNVMLGQLQQYLADLDPHHVLTIGDTNSTLAATLAAAELEIGLTHIEAGLRSGDRSMPEERNRVVADHLSDLLLVPSESALRNLDVEGLADRAEFTGDLSYDRLLAVIRDPEFRPRKRWGDPSVLFTVHRPSNLGAERSRWILEVLRFLCLHSNVLFPIHPRTASAISSDLRGIPGLQLADPLTHSATLEAITSAQLVVTDSGGIQREAFWLSRRCLTLRNETEWLETLEAGRNTLLTDENWQSQILEALGAPPLAPPPPYFGDGAASEKVLAGISKHLLA